MISLNDYVGVDEGFLGGQADGQAALQKAMVAGQITGRDTANQFLTQEPLKAESLEKTLKLLEFRAQDVRLWNLIPKLTAYNTVEEFLQLASYGAQRGGFYDEGELSDVEDSKYIRRAEMVKYMQVTGEVTMQAQMVRSYVDAMRQETENKVMWIMRLANRSLTHADSEIVPQQFNSIYKQHASIGVTDGFLYPTFEDYYKSGVVVDLRGKSLKQAHIEDAAVQVDLNYGNVSHLCAPTTIISSLAKDYYKTQRILLNNNYTGVVDTNPKVISTTLGDVTLVSDKFMKSDPSRLVSDPATSVKAPAAPIISGVTLAADGSSKFSSEEVGNVYYGVAAVNRYGESNMTVFSTPVTLAVGQAVDIAFTQGISSIAATGYTIYRTRVTTASAPTTEEFFPIFSISEAARANGFNGAAAGSTRDCGYFLPDTEQAFVTEMVDEVLSFKQLAPISKLDLAVQSMSRRFITFLFGTPQLYTPKKMVRFINCGKKYTEES